MDIIGSPIDMKATLERTESNEYYDMYVYSYGKHIHQYVLEGDSFAIESRIKDEIERYGMSISFLKVKDDGSKVVYRGWRKSVTKE